jgi:hypothetical protein
MGRYRAILLLCGLISGENWLTFIGIVTHKTSSGERQLGCNLPRRDIFVWAAVILYFNQLFGVVKEMSSASPATLVSDLCAVGIFQHMAWYVTLRLLTSSDAP